MHKRCALSSTVANRNPSIGGALPLKKWASKHRQKGSLPQTDRASAFYVKNFGTLRPFHMCYLAKCGLSRSSGTGTSVSTEISRRSASSNRLQFRADLIHSTQGQRFGPQLHFDSTVLVFWSLCAPSRMSRVGTLPSPEGEGRDIRYWWRHRVTAVYLGCNWMSPRSQSGTFRSSINALSPSLPSRSFGGREARAPSTSDSAHTTIQKPFESWAESLTLCPMGWIGSEL